MSLLFFNLFLEQLINLLLSTIGEVFIRKINIATLQIPGTEQVIPGAPSATVTAWNQLVLLIF